MLRDHVFSIDQEDFKEVLNKIKEISKEKEKERIEDKAAQQDYLVNLSKHLTLLL